MALAPDVIPANVLNSYVWAVLKANTTMTETDYGGNRPIIPASQEPEFTQYNKPFIVYGFAEDASSLNLAERGGTLVYVIYSQSVGEANKIWNIIVEALSRYDESARDINRYSSTKPNYVGMRFTTSMVVFAEGPSEADQEGGRQAATITVHYDYVAQYSVVTNV